MFVNIENKFTLISNSLPHTVNTSKIPCCGFELYEPSNIELEVTKIEDQNSPPLPLLMQYFMSRIGKSIELMKCHRLFA